MSKKCPCGKRIITDSWKCERCWRQLGKEVEIPSVALLSKLSWEYRALAFLYCAGQDVSGYFDTRLPLPPDNGDLIDALDYLYVPPRDAPFGWRSWHHLNP